MRNNKGMSLISVIVYIIAMILVISLMSVIAGYFYSNTDEIYATVSFNEKFVKINTYLSKEVNEEENTIILSDTINQGTTEEQTYILFSNGNQYTFVNENNSVYIGTYKLIDGIDECTFTLNEDNTLEIFLKSYEQEKNVTYQF